MTDYNVLSGHVCSVYFQLIYKGFGGSSKGLSFKDLLCGLVVLTKGIREERIKCKNKTLKRSHSLLLF